MTGIDKNLGQVDMDVVKRVRTSDALTLIAVSVVLFAAILVHAVGTAESLPELCRENPDGRVIVPGGLSTVNCTEFLADREGSGALRDTAERSSTERRGAVAVGPMYAEGVRVDPVTGEERVVSRQQAFFRQLYTGEKVPAGTFIDHGEVDGQ